MVVDKTKIITSSLDVSKTERKEKEKEKEKEKGWQRNLNIGKSEIPRMYFRWRMDEIQKRSEFIWVICCI